MMPGFIAIAAINSHLYGSAFVLGYGGLGDVFSPTVAPANLRNYGAWLIQSQTPIVALSLLPLVLRGSLREGETRDLLTRWESGPQRETTSVEIDLGSVRSIHGIVLALGPFADDFPRLLTVDTSEDGQTWTEVWRGTGGSLAFVGAFQSPRELPLTFELGGTRARLVRMRLLSTDPVYYWSIAELKVMGR